MSRFKKKMEVRSRRWKKKDVYKTQLEPIIENLIHGDFTGERSCHLTWGDGIIRNLNFKWWMHLDAEVEDIRNLWLDEDEDWDDYREVQQFSSQEPQEEGSSDLDIDIDAIMDNLRGLSLENGLRTPSGPPGDDEAFEEEILRLGRLLADWGHDDEGRLPGSPLVPLL